MGTVFACGCSRKPPNKDDVDDDKPVVTESNKTQPSDRSESNTNIHSSQEILDDSFKTRLFEAIDEHMASVPAAFQAERDRIVNEMERMAPERYLGLLFSEYPDINGLTVNEMARRLVTSPAAKQRLIDQIDKRIEPSFQSGTADWNSSCRETARPVIRTFIEKHVHEAFDCIELA